MKILAADLFCGAGGTSSGLLHAAKELRREVDLLAVNHWNVAIETHVLNHPGARHLCESLDGVDPRKVVPGGRLDLLCASPECTHHSIARGGKPRSDQSRATAWHILRWAEALRVENILIENVKEFRTWGPLTKRGQPMKRRKGETYQAFLNALRSLGYTVEDRVLNAADYGDATTRHRLFIMATKRNGPIHWPAASHVGRWKPAREIIDWQIKGQSIFTRKKPLSDNTLRRIMAGLRKFGGSAFVIGAGGPARSGEPATVNKPLGTVLTKNDRRLIEPFILNLSHGQSDGIRSSNHPIATVTTARGGELALVEPFIVNFHGNHKGRKDGDKRTKSIEEPLPTLDCSNRYGVAQPFIVSVNHGEGDDTRRSHSAEKPLSTLCGSNSLGVVEPFIVNLRGTDESHLSSSAKSVADPLRTVTTSGNHSALIESFLVKYYSTGGAQPTTEPLDTISTRDRFALVQPQADGHRLEILFRMLQPHELAAAMSFPAGYQFTGTREYQVKQIGNAVPVRTAAALCKALLK